MTKIMLVEDDKSLREIYGIRLVAEGYEIKSAGDGEQALAMAIKERPDLIISDVMMPKISGFDMLDILRATPETKDIKVIMMTALSSEDQRARGESLGANRYLVKSQVGIEDVVRTVHDVLGDAPVATAPLTQMFGAPGTPATTPETNSTPAPVEPITQPSEPQATINPDAIPPNPSTNPVQEPSTPQPVAPTPEPKPVQESTMPLPTAPFSSPAPASLVDSMIKPPQTITPPPTEPTRIPVSTPADTPVINSGPSLQPNPVQTPISVSNNGAQIPTQDIVIPRPPAPTTPDISTLIAQELGNETPPPQNPVQ